MKIKKYESFIKEEISQDTKYILKNLPYILGNRLITGLLGAAPLLSSKWKELKNKTQKKYAYYGGTTGRIHEELTKMKIEDLPDTPLKRGLFPLFNSWNIYKTSKKSTGGISKGPERTVIYISKDILQKGDHIISSREGSWETEEIGKFKHKDGRSYTKNRKADENDPIFILVAKYDIDESLHKDIVPEIEDVVIDNLSGYGLKLKKTEKSDGIYASLENDSLDLTFIGEEWTDQIFNEDIYVSLQDATKRIQNILKELGGDWNYTIKLYTGENNIKTETQAKLVGHFEEYKDEKYFWANLKEFGFKMTSDDKWRYDNTMRSLSQVPQFAREYAMKPKKGEGLNRMHRTEDNKIKLYFDILFPVNGTYMSIPLIKNNDTIIKKIDFSQKFDTISVYFKKV